MPNSDLWGHSRGGGTRNSCLRHASQPPPEIKEWPRHPSCAPSAASSDSPTAKGFQAPHSQVPADVQPCHDAGPYQSARGPERGCCCLSTTRDVCHTARAPRKAALDSRSPFRRLVTAGSRDREQLRVVARPRATASTGRRCPPPWAIATESHIPSFRVEGAPKADTERLPLAKRVQAV